MHQLPDARRGSRGSGVADGTSDARCPRYLRGKDTMVLTDGSLDLQLPVRDGSGRAVCTSFPSLSAVVTSFPSQEDQDFGVPDQDSVVAGVTATLPNLPTYLPLFWN